MRGNKIPPPTPHWMFQMRAIFAIFQPQTLIERVNWQHTLKWKWELNWENYWEQQRLQSILYLYGVYKYTSSGKAEKKDSGKSPEPVYFMYKQQDTDTDTEKNHVSAGYCYVLCTGNWIIEIIKKEWQCALTRSTTGANAVKKKRRLGETN